jgi:VWFA-related protein
MRRKRALNLISCAVLFLTAVCTQYSQFRSRVDLVVVDVSVRDSNGVLLTALDRDDFRVLEDGKPQTITNFSVDALPLSAAIVIDDGINADALKRLVPLLHALTESFKPDDEMISYRYDHLVWQLSSFTKDRDQIEMSFRELAQIAETRKDAPEQPGLYSKIEKKTPSFIKALAGLFTLGSIGAPTSSPTSVPTPRASRAAPDTRVMHSAVYDAATALKNRPKEYRKIILLISDGTVSEAQTTAIPGKTLHSFDKNLESLLQNEIQVYAVNTTASLLERSSNTLRWYADATGGDVYGGITSSNMQFAFNRITEQARTEYVLGYVSSNEAPPLGISRRIDVKSGEPDQMRKVTHRQGYTQYPIPK